MRAIVKEPEGGKKKGNGSRFPRIGGEKRDPEKSALSAGWHVKGRGETPLDDTGVTDKAARIACGKAQELPALRPDVRKRESETRFNQERERYQEESRDASV